MKGHGMVDDPSTKFLVRDALISLMTMRRVPSQSAFARSVKVSYGYMSDVLAGRRNLSPSMVQRIVEVYGLTHKQGADLHHRAAQASGWKLSPLPADQRVNIVTPFPKPPRNQMPKALPKAMRKVVVTVQKPKPASKKPPPARVLPKKPDKPIVQVSMDKGTPRAPGGFVPPRLEDLALDIEREMEDT